MKWHFNLGSSGTNRKQKYILNSSDQKLCISAMFLTIFLAFLIQKLTLKMFETLFIQTKASNNK